MKKNLLPLIGLVSLALSAPAALILNEPFDYADGSLTANSGGVWANFSGTAGQVNATNGAAFLTENESEDVHTYLPGRPYTEGFLYVSFRINLQKLPSGAGGCFALLKDAGTSNFRACLYASTYNADNGQYWLGMRITGANAAATAIYHEQIMVTNTDYQVVFRYDVANPAAALWINPLAETDWSAQVANAGETNLPIHTFALRQSLSSGNGMGAMTIDDLKIGAAFSDVVSAASPPSLTVIADQAIPAGGSTPALPFLVSDPDTPLASVSLSVASSNTNLVPTSNIVLGGAGSNRTVTVTGAPGQQGTAKITITARDNTALSTAREFTVRIGAPRLSPIGDQVTRVNTPLTAIPFTVADDEGDPLTLTVSSDDQSLLPEANLTIAGTGSNRTLAITPATDLAGYTRVTLTLGDGFHTVTNTFAVTVAPQLGILLAEDFSYPDGPLVSSPPGNIWTNHSGTLGQAQVEQGRLKISMSNSEDVSALLTNPPASTASGYILYSKFELNLVELPTNAAPFYFAHFKDPGTSVYRDKIFTTTNGAPEGKYRLGIANSANDPLAAVFTLDLATNQTYTVVTRYNVGSGVSTLWINPATEQDPSVTAVDNPAPAAVVAYAFREDRNIGTMYLDNLVIGTAFSDVVPPPQQLRLQTTVAGNTLILTWPVADGFILERSESLTSPNWQPAGTPGVIENQNYATNALTGPAAFFRLKKMP